MRGQVLAKAVGAVVGDKERAKYERVTILTTKRRHAQPGRVPRPSIIKKINPPKIKK